MKLWFSAVVAFLASGCVAQGYQCCGPRQLGRLSRLSRPSMGYYYAPTPAIIRRRREARFNKRAARFRDTFMEPRYEVTDNDSMFQVEIDVPGVEASDLNISLEEGDKVLVLSGERTRGTGKSLDSRKFHNRFSLDESVDVDNFTASLEKGVLTVRAPKIISQTDKNIRKIPIITPDNEEDDTKTL